MCEDKPNTIKIQGGIDLVKEHKEDLGYKSVITLENDKQHTILIRNVKVEELPNDERLIEGNNIKYPRFKIEGEDDFGWDIETFIEENKGRISVELYKNNIEFSYDENITFKPKDIYLEGEIMYINDKDELNREVG